MKKLFLLIALTLCNVTFNAQTGVTCSGSTGTGACVKAISPTLQGVIHTTSTSLTSTVGGSWWYGANTSFSNALNTGFTYYRPSSTFGEHVATWKNQATGVQLLLSNIGSTSAGRFKPLRNQAIGLCDSAGTDGVKVSPGGRVVIGVQSSTQAAQLYVQGDVKATSSVVASGFAIPGGTSSQYLLADGTVGSGGGGGGSLPATQIAVGSGTSITSYSSALIKSTGSATFGTGGMQNADNAYIRINAVFDPANNFDGTGFQDFMRVATTTTSNVNYQSFGAFYGNETGDATGDWDDVGAFLHGPDLGATATYTMMYGYWDAPRIRGSVNLLERRAINIEDIDVFNTATCGPNVGIRVAYMDGGSTNKAIDIIGDNITETAGQVLVKDLRANVRDSPIDRLVLSSPNDGNYDVYTKMMFQAGGQAVIRLEGGLAELSPPNTPGNGYGVLNIKGMNNTFGGDGDANTGQNIISFYGDNSVKFYGNIYNANSTINTTAGDAATINSISGRFRKDASGSTFTLTNSFITANSIIICTRVTSGITTGYDIVAVAGSGSATITFETAGVAAAPSANCDVNFWIIN